VTNDYEDIILNHRQGGVAVSPIDIENDGDLDLAFSACFGLQLYMNPENPTNKAYDDVKILPHAGGILKAYPNPFNCSITMLIGGGNEDGIEIVDISGRKVAKIFTVNGRVMWEAKGLSSGIYFAYRLNGKKKSNAVKLIYLK
jgi:hypothetical protein